MAISVVHATTAAGPNDPTKQVSSDAWNEGHTVTGLATVAETGAYSDLSGTPSLATVATTGAYSDLSGKPTLGTAAAENVGYFALASHTHTASAITDFSTAADARVSAAIGVSVQAYAANLAAWAGVNPSSYSTTAQIAAAYQPLSANLTSWSAVAPGSYLTTAAAASAYQPLDSDLTTIAGLTATTDNFIVSVASAWASRTPSQVRTTLGLVIGTDVQAYSSVLANTTASFTTALETKLNGIETAADVTDATNVAAAGAAMLATENQALTGGATVTSKSLGTQTSGTLTLDLGDRPLQHYTNGGAHTLAPGSVNSSALVDITNNGSAGAITTSGWTKVAGSAFTTTNGHKFRCHCSVGDGGSLLIVQALQ